MHGGEGCRLECHSSGILALSFETRSLTGLELTSKLVSPRDLPFSPVSMLIGFCCCCFYLYFCLFFHTWVLGLKPRSCAWVTGIFLVDWTIPPSTPPPESSGSFSSSAFAHLKVTLTSSVQTWWQCFRGNQWTVNSPLYQLSFARVNQVTRSCSLLPREKRFAETCVNSFYIPLIWACLKSSHREMSLDDSVGNKVGSIASRLQGNLAETTLHLCYWCVSNTSVSV